MLSRFHVVVFDESCAEVMERLRRKHKRRKRYADLMIAATAEAGRHIVVTRNQTDFVDLLPMETRCLPKTMPHAVGEKVRNE